MKFYSVVLLSMLAELAKASTVQTGKVSLKTKPPPPGGTLCRTVKFPSAFSVAIRVKVFVSLSHGDTFAEVHDACIPWVESVTRNSFKVCIVETGDGSKNMAVVNWLAFQGSPSGLQCGSVLFRLLATGTLCQSVVPSSPFSKVFITPRHSVVGREQDAAFFWVEYGKSSFKICLREVTNMDGLHENITVDWFVYDSKPSSLNIVFTNSISFKNDQAPLLRNKLAYCENGSFPLPFYSPPMMLVSSVSPSPTSSCNAFISWLEEITKFSFKVCVKDLVPIGAKHDPIKLDYLVIGELNPCHNVVCSYYGVCKPIGPYEAVCVCEEICPSYNNPVCSSTGTSFENICKYQLHVCKTRSNETIHHPGLCVEFPFAKGQREMEAVLHSADVYCHDITLTPYTFYPEKPIYVQATVTYTSSTRPKYVHDAAVAWVEDVRKYKFTSCLAQVGRNERASFGIPTVDWLAYQGAPAGGVAGQTTMRDWWSGTTCKTVKLPKGKFILKPTVLATTQRLQTKVKHDAAYLWVEDVTTTSFRVCLREVQNFDGFHAEINVNWLAFDSVQSPLFSEHRSVFFPNKVPPTLETNGAYCKDLVFNKKHTVPPSIILAANHSTKGDNLDPIYNTITAWVEYINPRGFRTCVKELYVNKYDPVSVSYTVLGDVCKPGWTYFNGICHIASQKCANWYDAQKVCRSLGSNLVTIRHQEDNVFVQHRHQGGGTWLGLTEIKEGKFCWISNETSSFTFWKAGDKNDPTRLECGFAMGASSQYKWCHEPCSVCHNYTCAVDYNECRHGSHNCHPAAACNNTYGSYKCYCPKGYTGDGFYCEDIDECIKRKHHCDALATCQNTMGSYQCICKPGYIGDGKTCADQDECSSGSHSCDVNAYCINTLGSYTCKCKSNYTGNGFECEEYGWLKPATFGNWTDDGLLFEGDLSGGSDEIFRYGPARVFAAPIHSFNYVITSKMLIKNGKGCGHIIKKKEDSEITPSLVTKAWGYFPWANNYLFISSDGREASPKINYKFPSDEWLTLKTIVRGTNVKIYINDKFVYQLTIKGDGSSSTSDNYVGLWCRSTACVCGKDFMVEHL